VTPAASLNHTTGLLQNIVADRMTVSIIIMLKIVNVEDKKSNVQIVLAGKTENLRQKLTQIAAVF